MSSDRMIVVVVTERSMTVPCTVPARMLYIQSPVIYSSHLGVFIKLSLDVL